MTEDQFFNIDEVADYLRIPKSTIYKLSQKKGLPSSKIGKQLRFRKSSVDEWLTRKEGAAGANYANYIGKEIGGSVNARGGVSGKKKRILLIEDDQLVLKGLFRFLNAHGYNLELAVNGEEALEKIKSANFGLIICDVRMPGINGIETIKRIREFYRRKNRQAPAEIVITGYLDAQAQQEAQNLGISDYLYKPFSTADFLQTIQKKIATG
jgi:excisionase family DNA binding protein